MLLKARMGPVDHAEILVLVHHYGQCRQNGVQGRVTTLSLVPNAMKFASGSSLFEL